MLVYRDLFMTPSQLLNCVTLRSFAKKADVEQSIGMSPPSSALIPVKLRLLPVSPKNILTMAERTKVDVHREKAA